MHNSAHAMSMSLFWTPSNKALRSTGKILFLSIMKHPKRLKIMFKDNNSNHLYTY